MEKVRAHTHELIRSSQALSKARYDQHRRPPVYEEGALVLLRDLNPGRKLRERWLSPYRIIETLNDGLNLTIQHLKRQDTSINVHVNRTTPFHVRENSATS